MKRFLFIVLLSICGIWAFASAKNDSIEMRTVIRDAYTGGIIKNGKMEILTRDSALVCVGTWIDEKDFRVETRTAAMGKVPMTGIYIIKLSHPDYVTTYYPTCADEMYNDPRYKNSYSDIPMVKRLRKVQPDEVSAKVKEIELTVKGDTLILDADFLVSQASLLDVLFKKIPGLKLKTNGNLIVNGEDLVTFRVNGDVFPEISHKVFLENLPCYMVKSVSIYENKGDSDDEPYLVMNVNIKR